MSQRAPVADSAATMIVPAATEIEVDRFGQLSIRTPGSLVLQNSGNYNLLESTGGSIRIETGARVEAVTVRCAGTCFVEGSLTAWKVQAREIHLEDAARAHIVLQEAEKLLVGRNARLVGNFASENELFLLFSRFGDQFRTLPSQLDAGQEVPRLGPPAYGEGAAAPQPAASAAAAPEDEDLPETLLFAEVLLARDAARGAYGQHSQRALEQILRLLRERDLETLRATHRTLFARLVDPGADARRARRLVEDHYKEA